MSYEEATAPSCVDCDGAVEVRIEPHEKDLGEFTVRRVLPSAKRRMVGPFIFFDHMGPAEFPPGKGVNVRPHPHIGIATITYLFEGEIMHRDDLGYVQPIQAGAVNLMTAGRGIVHSERAGSDFDEHSALHGIQSWLALPADKQEIEPAFQHIAADELPELQMSGSRIRVIMGEAYGKKSPVPLHSATLYVEALIPAGAVLESPGGHEELAAYIVSGEVEIDAEHYASGVMAVAAPGQTLIVAAKSDSRVMFVGGDNLGKRKLWWNFVSDSPERIEQAKQDWNAGRFGTVPGDDEFIPLPD